MLKVENVIAPSDEQMEAVIRGMRNPMNSWDRSDSYWQKGTMCDDVSFMVGKNDLNLMHRLYTAGSEHRKYLRMIPVYMDVTAPLYWWKEFDTYKVGTVRNSCSTMHKIMSKEFTESDFSFSHCDRDYAESMIYRLNQLRGHYLQEQDVQKKKDIWYELIQFLPSAYMQKATIMMNYETVINIIHQRKNHKLNEWHVFVDSLEMLPYIDEIMGDDEHVD